jgi:uncharacterized protein (TIGR02118 family)
MAGASVMAVYVRKEGSTFDKEYYLSSHMPLTFKHWKKHGMKGYKVTELNADSPYSYIVVMDFETPEGFEAAVKDADTKEVMEDIKNFSSEEPIMVYGMNIGTN